jgi:hypothetical protein
MFYQFKKFLPFFVLTLMFWNHSGFSQSEKISVHSEEWWMCSAKDDPDFGAFDTYNGEGSSRKEARRNALLNCDSLSQFPSTCTLKDCTLW